MLYELDKNDYAKVRPLFAELAEYNCAVNSIFEDVIASKAVVDDPQNPQSAFIYGAHSSFLGGNPHNLEFNHAVNALIASADFANDPIRGWPVMVVLQCHPAAWCDQFPVLFGNRPPINAAARHLVFRQLPFAWRTRIPAGFEVRRLDKTILENMRLKNSDNVLEWFQDNWATRLENYYQKGVGVCLLRGDEIASWCFTAVVAGKTCELAIETADDYRRQGLGTFVTVATVDLCLERGFTLIDWHCDVDNVGSWSTAEKAGFVQERDYTMYGYFLDAVIHFTAAGDYACRAKHYPEAIHWYQKAFAAGDAPNRAHYQAARAYAATDVPDAAFVQLNIAIDKGWTDVTRLENCAEFQSLQAAPEWAAIWARLKNSGTMKQSTNP